MQENSSFTITFHNQNTKEELNKALIKIVVEAMSYVVQEEKVHKTINKKLKTVKECSV